MTASHALRHPWISDHNVVPDTPISVRTRLLAPFCGRPLMERCAGLGCLPALALCCVAAQSAVLKSLGEFRVQCRLKKAVAKVLAKHMTEDDERELERLFKQFDKNGDGRLSAVWICSCLI